MVLLGVSLLGKSEPRGRGIGEVRGHEALKLFEASRFVASNTPPRLGVSWVTQSACWLRSVWLGFPSIASATPNHSTPVTANFTTGIASWAS